MPSLLMLLSMLPSVLAFSGCTSGLLAVPRLSFRGCLAHTSSQPLLRRAFKKGIGSCTVIRAGPSGWQGDFDPEDPWDKALDDIEAQRKKAADEAEIGDDCVAVGWDGTSILLDSERERKDESADWEFYDSSRLVFHADNDVFVRLTALYRDLIPPSGQILDVGSSWVSHLPEDVSFARVEGLGMNEVELKSNPRLDAFRVQDLNVAPDMRLPANAYDAVLMCFAIQYFKYPEKVLSQLIEALAPGGVLILSWGTGCFTGKAIKGWLDRDQEGRIGLVLRLLAIAGFVDAKVHLDLRVNPTWVGADELVVISARRRPGAEFEGGARMQDDSTLISKPFASAATLGQPPIYAPNLAIRALSLGDDSALVWEDRLQELMQEAQAMGIPPSALQDLVKELPQTPDAESLRLVMKEIQLIIASRLSSNL